MPRLQLSNWLGRNYDSQKIVLDPPQFNYSLSSPTLILLWKCCESRFFFGQTFLFAVCNYGSTQKLTGDEMDYFWFANAITKWLNDQIIRWMTSFSKNFVKRQELGLYISPGTVLTLDSIKCCKINGSLVVFTFSFFFSKLREHKHYQIYGYSNMR